MAPTMKIMFSQFLNFRNWSAGFSSSPRRRFLIYGVSLSIVLLVRVRYLLIAYSQGVAHSPEDVVLAVDGLAAEFAVVFLQFGMFAVYRLLVGDSLLGAGPYARGAFGLIFVADALHGHLDVAVRRLGYQGIVEHRPVERQKRVGEYQPFFYAGRYGVLPLVTTAILLVGNCPSSWVMPCITSYTAW